MSTDRGLLSVVNLVKHFDISGGMLDQLSLEKGRIVRKRTTVKAVNDVSFTILPGETLSVVGESGCGKSTLARTIMGLYPPDRGHVYYKADRIDHLSPRQMRPFRAKMQMIFQDPYASLNPRKTVRQTLEEPLTFHHRHLSKKEVKEKVAVVMDQVGVDPQWVDRYPHEFSGGQRQRISIARALMVDPEFIVADEPVSALDVSIQAQIINLLIDLQEEFDLSYIIIAHDLAVVEHICDRIAVMYLGKIVEMAAYDDIYNHPKHPYTEALLSAIPVPDPKMHKRRIILKGDVPSPINPPMGCHFHPRCPHRMEHCDKDEPHLKDMGDNHFVACYLY